METCPRGCDAFLEYVGIDDGFGMNGDMLCELWECPACGEQVIGECHSIPDHDEHPGIYPQEYSWECSMCGQDMPHSATGRCSRCEQVWNG